MPTSLARRRSRMLIAGGAAVAAMLLASAAVALAANRAVAIAGFAFSPATLTVNAGDRVTWTNSDSVAHTATASSGAFDTGSIAPGESASVRFTQAGTYQYVCTPHPTMTGTIRVRAATGGPTDPPTDTIEPASPADSGAGMAPAVVVGAAVLLLAFLVPRRRRSH
jgi:plastocyanin